MPTTDRWTSQIDKITDDFRSNFGQLNKDELNWKPDPKSWSVAQNVDHLIIINNTYYQRIESLRNGELTLPGIARIGFIVNLFGKTILNAVKPDRKKKTKTFEIWEPTQTLIDSGILNRFENDQKLLKKVVADSGELLKGNAVISSPANSMLVLKLETAFDIIVSHEQRHLEQAREVFALLRKRK